MTTSAVLRINMSLRRFAAVVLRITTPLDRFGAALPPLSALVPRAAAQPLLGVERPAAAVRTPVLRICAPRAGIRQVGAP